MNNGFHERYSPLQQGDDEERNIENLRSKVSRLKEITIDINEEVIRQNRMFDDINTDLDNLRLKFSNIISSVKDIISTGSSSRYFWYALAAFVILMFFIIIFRR